MANILYLVHRLPFPPDKGDKVRSYHLLKHLVARHRVYLAAFVDSPNDWQHVEHLKTLCAEVHAVGLQPRGAKILSLRGLLTGEALGLPYYRSGTMRARVRSLSQRVSLDAAVVFSSTMAQYALPLRQVPALVDFVDVDSAKWSDYGRAHAWPMSWIYGREGRKLLAYEQQVAREARCSFFVTANEAALFQQLSPGLNAAVDVLGNGVDADHFSPDPERASPYAPGEQAVVFTGAMDYWPNVDAVCWFVDEAFPRLRERFPNLRFYIVGRSPTPAVQALAGKPGVLVTGTVPDVRPYLQHAAAAVASLRVARGIQNKVLEAMAMGRPVVVARPCAEVIDARDGAELVTAETAQDYVERLSELLREPQRCEQIGAAGRRCVQARYSWDAHLSAVDRHLDPLLEGRVGV